MPCRNSYIDMTKAPLLPFKIPSPTSSSPSPYSHRSSPSSASNFTPRRLFPALSLLTIILLTTASWHFSGSAPSTSSVMNYWNGGNLVADGAASFPVSSSSSPAKTGGKDSWQQATEALDVGASLEERLAAWESSPRNEPADWVSKNLEVSFHYISARRSGGKGRRTTQRRAQLTYASHLFLTRLPPHSNRSSLHNNHLQHPSLSSRLASSPVALLSTRLITARSSLDSPLHQTCPDYRIRPNQNTGMLDKSHLLWAAMNSSRILGLRGEMVSYLRKAEKEGKMSEKAWGRGRGLVFTAGNSVSLDP